MTTAGTPYSIRLSTPLDAEVIANHRAMMFRDMGLVTGQETEQLFAASVPWLRHVLTTGEYVGWLVLYEEQVIAGGGIHVREMGPVPHCYRVGRWGHIANVYTVAEHRRRGLARLLMSTILAWCAENQFDQVTLAASDDGRPLYESLGFTASNEMKLSGSVHSAR